MIRDAPGIEGIAHTRDAWVTGGLSYRYAGSEEEAVRELSIRIRRAACTAILGPNGSGKSTLLKLLLGVLRPTLGDVKLQERSIEDWPRRELARTVGVVPQDEEIAFPITVREFVGMGRYPHLGPLQTEREVDARAVAVAMRRTDVAGLAGRQLQKLSGGERQRARLARALAQEPTILALDEPTRALDIRHEMEMLELLRRLVTEGVTVVLVTHNLNLAARYADELVLLDRGRLVAQGSPRAVLQRDRVESVYQWPVRITSHPGPGPDAGAVQVTPLSNSLQNIDEH